MGTAAGGKAMMFAFSVCATVPIGTFHGVHFLATGDFSHCLLGVGSRQLTQRQAYQEANQGPITQKSHVNGVSQGISQEGLLGIIPERDGSL